MKPRQAFVPFITLLFKQPRSILKALLRFTREAYRSSQFTGKKVKKIDILDLVGSMNEEVKSYTYLDGTSRTIDIAFLKAICKQYKNCNYLEIGSWRGESILNVASVVEKCTSVSLSKKEMIQIGLSESDAASLNLFSKDLKNVRHIEANSLTYDFNELGDRFDVIFIDGDHSYEGVKSDTKNAFNLLKDRNSVIIWHDCGFGMQDLRYESITAIANGCTKEQFENVYRVSNTMCAIYTNKELNENMSEFDSYPNKLFDVQIKSAPYNIR